MSKTIDDARRLIQSRLTEIDEEAARLERALGTLGEKGLSSRGRIDRASKAAASSAVGPKRRPVRKARGARRAARGQRRDELLAAIKAAPGARPSELAGSIGINPTQVHALIAKARTEKLIVKSAQGYALTGKGARATP